jgi:hypothetical protein
MGRKGSGRPKMSYKRTLAEICGLLRGIDEQLEAINAKMSV